ncbi:hypothetical protein F5B22DRAFT_613183 [Xylaria bambusicola]|uniref:uncharacterized protein n=1 Tax=Xylaria bambusicola TaxID=326684 RepID=UPI0020073242|nr:uncharacterized protein F5B22DRAFT_613183 [Xylaria bambusicola]KAI0513034.1 hypothetical protein F5B22DRAFT_613183 [Xylaria bambusicola]
MAGLTPQHSHPMGRMVLDFTSPNQCVVQMAAPPACGCGNTFEIVVKQQRIDTDSICITPTGPLPGPVDQQSRPVSLPAPPGNGDPSPSWWTTSWPMDPGTVDQKTPPKPYHVPVKEDPAVPRPTVNHPSSHPVYTKLPVSTLKPGDPSPTPVVIIPSSKNSTLSTTSGTTSSRVTSSPTKSSPTVATITRVVTTSPLPPPSRPQQPSPSRSASPPAPTSGVCNASYTSIDVSELTGLEPHYFSQYLNLLGIGDLLDEILGGVEGLLKGLIGKGGNHPKLVHEFRVRCDVDIPESPVWPEWNEERHDVTDGERGCLETCERQVIKMAGMGLLQECIGVAYRDKPGMGKAREGEGECRFWRGDGDKHEFLPVDSLPSAKGERRPGDGRWQIIYM